MEAKSGSELGLKMLAAVKDYFARAIEPITSRIASVEQRLADLPVPVDGAPGRNGVDGKDGVPGPVGESGPQGDQGAQGEAGPAGKDGVQGMAGEPGKDGVEGAQGPQGEMGQAGKDGMQGAAGEPGPQGAIGGQGPQGLQGEMGPAGKDVSLEAIAQLIESSVTNAVSAIPAPKDGIPGDKGDSGRDGRDGKDGREGVDGINGIHGRDGKDALHVDEFVAELKEDGRTITFRLSSGGKEFASEIRLDVPLDRGVYRPATAYARGDFVSWDGSGWIAQKDTEDKPGTSDSWRLSVKRGRDGKDAKTEPVAVSREPVKIK